MQPRLVFVHGVGSPRRVDDERQAWCDALIQGAGAAGHPHLAALLTGAAAPVFAHYGDLFRRPGAQGGPPGRDLDSADPELAALTADLLANMIDEQLSDETEPERQRVLRDARAYLSPVGTPQGVGEVARRIIGAATRMLDARPIRPAGRMLTGRLLGSHLAQVARYLRRGEPDAGTTLDQRIRGRVAEAIREAGEPVVVVGHSLGSVVAWETLHESGVEVPLFVTLGSPITMRSVVWHRLRPQPPATPDRVGQWCNAWDRDDIIATRPRFEDDLVANRAGVLPRSVRVDSDGWWVHTATTYLAQPAVGGPIAAALTAGAGSA